jgi:beta-glucosidase
MTAGSVNIDLLVEAMTVDEKIGQMTQVSNDSITPAEVADHFIGSVLSGGEGNPTPNTPATWVDMVGGFVEAAAGSRLGVPLIYGIDAVHGHSNVRGATIFPHNIGLGSAADPDLVERIGRATATEMLATGVRWAFAPTVAVPQDLRWGRTYEGYGRDPGLVATLGAALVRGLQGRRSGRCWHVPSTSWPTEPPPGTRRPASTGPIGGTAGETAGESIRAMPGSPNTSCVPCTSRPIGPSSTPAP